MKIIIAGAGEVGTHLAKMLSQENHDIILMDPDEKRLLLPGSNSEILPMVGDPTSLRDLENAGISKTDLFISVTPYEPTNITACILASNLGAIKTFARINNYEYLLPKNKERFEKLGINAMIYPEMLAAREIVTAVQHPWARQYWELFGGMLILVGVKIRSNSRLVGKYLYELKEDDKLFHVVAIKRRNSTIIPNGTDCISDGDIVFFTTTKAHVKDVQTQAGKNNPEVKKIFIMGASRIALRSCQYLPNNIRIKVLETNDETSQSFAEVAPGNVLVINGDGRNTELLIQEGIRDAQAFIALTDNPSTNILACLAAKQFGVSKTIAQVENLDYIPLANDMDIGSVINKKLITAGNIYQFLLDADVANMKFLAFSNADVAEVIVKPGSKVTKKPIKDLGLPKDLTLGGLIRNGEPMIIHGDIQLQENDHVVIFCLENVIHELEKIFR
ncbi:Trk system potassium transporter TrkA [Massilibacteroides sp.]|uniref:Trk system potassium transporter TrkA n=1 Tax=Massilibacteroides sp. TaxID=2034766 RepID=UPI0026236F62|nr:Trk system potassium transporter TrkA [Massilibacteroides sp.]MDD4514809.1 Trk system potassium transporter TrkA [Massilibacteroides sp.]